MGEEPLAALLDDVVVRRVRAVLADRPDAVVTLGDEAGHLRWASDEGTRGMFGRRPADVAGRTRFDYVHPRDVDRARRQFARALEGETVRYGLRVRAADGTWVQVSSVAWSVVGPWGRWVVTITTADDGDPVWPQAGQR